MNTHPPARLAPRSSRLLSLRRGFPCLLLFLGSLCAVGGGIPAAETLNVPNAEFDRGDTAPEAWRLEGAGRWVERQWLEVKGQGDDSSLWRCDGLSFQPGRTYRFETRLRRISGSGMAITGPNFANRDHVGLASDWQWVGHAFRVPDQCDGGFLRLGQWHATGAIQFDRVRVTPAVPVHRAAGDLTLGEGESVRDGQYTFSGSFGHEGSNYHRTLRSATAWFNSDRWLFSAGSQVSYEFGLPQHDWLSARVEVNVNYHTSGRCVVEISRDGQTWLPLATPAGEGGAAAEVPAKLLPAPRLLVRLRSDGARVNLQVDRVEFSGRLSGAACDLTGETVWADLAPAAADLTIESMRLQRDAGTGHDQLWVSVRNAANRERKLRLSLSGGTGSGETPAVAVALPRQSCPLQAALPSRGAGIHQMTFQILDGAVALAEGRLTIRVPDFYRSDYGQRIAGVAGDTAVWWCDATRKVPRGRPVPQAAGDGVCLEAAQNDFEAAQIVVRPARHLRGLTATASELRGPDGATLAADRVQILYVYYHFVQQPTDATGVRDWWPDALPPLAKPLDVAAGQNQPLWVLVQVPTGTRPGDYRGQIRLQAEGFSAQIPLDLHVWNFALPQGNHLRTAFGLSVGNIFRYHGAKTEADKRRVLALYHQSFADHRISPYDPAPLDRIGVKFLPQENPPRAEVDFTAFDRAMSEAVSKYHFNNFDVPIEGMGGGTFHERTTPRIGQFGEDTPQYQAMFSHYAGQLEAHFRQRGWLDMAYVYWFDEPEPRDYEFVAQGMRRLKQAAPGLRRMLTEEPGENILAGLVDIWCPVSSNYDHAEAEKRRAHGEAFWWYVCTGPKAPYCTLFIDHPATELRVWHWQTWQRNIVGTLVWQTNYWTSSAAYPDQPQNPYEDPMGYVSGYSTPRGVKRYWGNGDGRFIYPPLAVAVPGASGDEPVIAPPVSSIRWEMLREGVEDYECLHLLRELIQQRRSQLPPAEVRRLEDLLLVPAAITAEMTKFTTDPAPIYDHRRVVAEAIEHLGGSEGLRRGP